MLVTFEGQDGAGKSTLLRGVFTQLKMQGVAATTVDEFSDSPYGQRLLDALARDKFLRPLPDEPATVRARALDIVADLYYLDERVIRPALAAGLVVLKDRHVDTIFCTQVPAITQAGASDGEAQALMWLGMVLSQLQHKPAVTVCVEAPLKVRRARIQHRDRHLTEARAHEISDDDIAVFAARQRIMRQLVAAEPTRFAVIENGHRPLHEGVNEVLALVLARRARRS
jgi:thymidylate kinase